MRGAPGLRPTVPTGPAPVPSRWLEATVVGPGAEASTEGTPTNVWGGGMRTQVGIVGAGYVSTYHVRALKTLPHVAIVGIADLVLGRFIDTRGIGWTIGALLAFGFALDALYGVMAPERQRI